jgi:electron transport complex protein RnfE
MAKGYTKQFTSGIIDNNPTFVQLLGMCPTLAVSTSLDNAVGMGIAATAVLAASNVVISLLRKFIPSKVRIAAYVVIIAAFVTVIDLLMQAYLPALSKSLGLYIPLIVVNCIILARAEAFASKNGIMPSFIDGLSMGVGFTLALSAIAIILEILGSGTIYGLSLFGHEFTPAAVMIMAPGGFLTLGCLIALVQKLKAKTADKKEVENNELD